MKLKSSIQNNKRLTAFTLSDVLITLGIIGMIAQMTIPTLVQNVQNQASVSSLKKAYSNMSQAYIMAVQENGTPDNWNLIDYANPQGSANILNILTPYLKTIKNCGSNAGCFANAYTFLNGAAASYNFNSDDKFAKAILADGATISTYTYGNCNTSLGSTPALNNVCGAILVDINGTKNPNQWGIDLFQLYISKNGLIPSGTEQQTTAPTFGNECLNKNSSERGLSCAAWVIYNENMDYTKCQNLDWGTKNKCN